MELLKLIALDDDDLKVVSAHLQDAISRVEDMAFLSRERRFVMLMNRFDWARAAEDAASNGQGYQRRRCALRFEKVHKAQVRQISLDDRAGVLELLAVHFESGDSPSGYITLTFAGAARCGCMSIVSRPSFPILGRSGKRRESLNIPERDRFELNRSCSRKLRAERHGTPIEHRRSGFRGTV
jgi:hypothetical protein